MKESVFTIRTEPGQGQNIISHTVDEALDIIGMGWISGQFRICHCVTRDSLQAVESSSITCSCPVEYS